MKLKNVLQGNIETIPPVWFMRQAGRYLPEYMALRQKAGDFLTMCYTPDYATEVTLQPIRRFDFDAAIIFSDILVIPHAMGQEVNFKKGEGPVLGELDIEKLEFNIDFLNPVFNALKNVRSELNNDKALIGFSGAPWTIACYMIEGKGSKDWQLARSFSKEKSDLFEKLIEKLISAISEYLIKKIDNGADVVQIFDSWSGVLSEKDFDKFCIQPTKIIIENIRKTHPDTPIIGFPKGAGFNTQKYINETGITALGMDTTVPINMAKKFQEICPVQGNLDPVSLLCGGDILTNEVKRLMDNLAEKPFIFNLGHGIIKETPIDHVQQVLDTIRSYK